MKRALVLLSLLAAACPSPSSTPAVEDPAPSPAPGPGDDPAPAGATGQVTRDGDALIVTPPPAFEGEALDLAASAPGLTALRDFLRDHDDYTMIRIEGHAVTDLDEESELMLTGERAFQVGVWLREQGIACERLLAAAFGRSKPIAPNDTPENRARNTRISFVVAELRGRAIGGMPVDGGAFAATNVCP